MENTPVLTRSGHYNEVALLMSWLLGLAAVYILCVQHIRNKGK